MEMIPEPSSSQFAFLLSRAILCIACRKLSLKTAMETSPFIVASPKTLIKITLRVLFFLSKNISPHGNKEQQAEDLPHSARPFCKTPLCFSKKNL